MTPARRAHTPDSVAALHATGTPRQQACAQDFWIGAYLLIELIGLRETTLVAVGLNLCAGGGALLMSRVFGAAAAGPRTAADAPLAAQAQKLKRRWTERQHLVSSS
jgi:hypothetical protein